MAYKIKVQDGNIVYAAADSSNDVNFDIRGHLNITNGLTVESPTTEISLNGTLWPDGTVAPVPGMYLGVSAPDTLQFYTLPTAIDSAVPYYIPITETFTVEINKQALFNLPIVIDGYLVVDGALIEIADEPGGGGTIARPLDEIVIGTGPGVTSFPTAKYVGTTTGLEINNNPFSFPVNSEAITVDDPGDIFIYGANNSGLGLNRSASIYMLCGVADNVNLTTTAGEFIIRSGRNQHGLSGPTRGASEILLTNHVANNTNGTASSLLMYAGGTTDGNTVLGPRNGGGVNIRAGHGRRTAGTFDIAAGNSIGLSSSAQFAGDMYISAGNVNGVGGSGAATGIAGSVYISAGRNLAPGSPNSGSITFTTKNIDRLVILDSGEFSLQGDVGIAGQVLSSQGPGLPPQWITVSGGGSAMRIVTSAVDYTLQIDDAFDTLIRITKATPAIVTIPNDTTLDFPIGSAVLVSWNGVGMVTIGYEVGVTVDTPDTYNIARQFGKITAIKTGANHWEIEGNLEPVI